MASLLLKVPCDTQALGSRKVVIMGTDRHSVETSDDLRPGMVVRGALGRELGTISEIAAGSAGGTPASFTVKHGLFGRKAKQIPAHEVKEIQGDTVFLRFTRTEFNELPNTG
jgi:hypothetical protein